MIATVNHLVTLNLFELNSIVTFGAAWAGD
jgi:hypothetical protein